MKNLILLLLFNFSLIAINANTGIEKDCFPIHSDYLAPYQSSTDGKNVAENALDGDPKTSSVTSIDDRSWFLIEFQGETKIKEVSISSPTLKDYYVFFSKAEFVSNNISELLKDPWVEYVHVKKDEKEDEGNPDVVPVQNVISRYVLLLPVISEIIRIEEIRFCGTGPGDPEGPLPCDICPEPDVLGPWSTENCSNGIDDDGDGYIDCHDASCGVGNVKTYVRDATCETCSDGRLCFRASNATHFSIDGGVTWVPVTGWWFWKRACFDNLLPGIYNVMVKNEKTGCEGLPFSVVVGSPPPSDDPCDDSGFENGFNGWTGGNGGAMNGISITDNIIAAPMHVIIPTSGFADTNAPGLTAPPSSVGNNVARLGNTTAGGTAHALTYCFDVIDDNFSINFLNAIVLNNPNHNGPSGFRYRVYNSNSPNNNIVGPVVTNSTDPVLQQGTGSFMFLDWNCNSINVNGQKDNTICIEFIAHGCSQTAHAGYAYIDLLCEDSVSPPENLNIDVTLDEDFCDAINADVSGSGNFYHSYNWEIELFRNGSYSNKIKTDVVRELNPTMTDVFQMFQEEEGYILECGDQLSVKLYLYNDCTSASTSVLIDVPCITWKAAYPNIIAHNPNNPANENFNIYFNATNFEAGETPSCEVMNNDITTISYYRLLVFDKWGNKVFDEEVSSSDANILGTEIVWDGDFNGVPVVTGVFVWEAYVISCGSYMDCSNDCGNFQYCSDGDLQDVKNKAGDDIIAEVFAGDVTVID